MHLPIRRGISRAGSGSELPPGRGQPPAGKPRTRSERWHSPLNLTPCGPPARSGLFMSGPILRARGGASLYNQDYPAAVSDFTCVLAQEGPQSDIHVHRAVAYMGLQAWDKALRDVPTFRRNCPGRPGPGTDGPLPTDRADLTACPTSGPLRRGLADSPILAGTVSGRGFPIGLLACHHKEIQLCTQTTRPVCGPLDEPVSCVPYGSYTRYLMTTIHKLRCLV